MNSLKIVKILLSPLWLHSASSIQIPQSTNRYNFMLTSVYVSPLKLHSAAKTNLHGVSDSALFRNHFKVRLSPLKSPVLRNSMSSYRSVGYPSISKCNVKRCSCCKHLFCKSTIKSYVIGRHFSELLILILMGDQPMLFMFYLEKSKIVPCNMLAKLVDFYKLDFLSTIVE